MIILVILLVTVSIQTMHVLQMEVAYWKKDALNLTGNPQVSTYRNYPKYIYSPNWYLLFNLSFFNYFDAIVCSLIGSWSNWSDYGECTVTCGVGSQTRTRECVVVPGTGGGIAVPGGGGGGIAVPGRRRKRSTCSGDSMQTQECEIQSCPGTILHINSFLSNLRPSNKRKTNL